ERKPEDVAEGDERALGGVRLGRLDAVLDSLPHRGAEASVATGALAWRSQCGETGASMPAVAAARFTVPSTARSVSRPPPLRPGDTGSSAAAWPARGNRPR